MTKYWASPITQIDPIAENSAHRPEDASVMRTLLKWCQLRTTKITTPTISSRIATGARGSVSSRIASARMIPPTNGKTICTTPSRFAGGGLGKVNAHSDMASATGNRKPTTMIAGCESSPPAGRYCLPVASISPQSTPSTPPAIDVATATRKPMWGTPSRMWRARIAIQTKKAAITSVEMIPIVGRNSL